MDWEVTRDHLYHPFYHNVILNFNYIHRSHPNLFIPISSYIHHSLINDEFSRLFRSRWVKIIVGVAFLCFITTQWILLFLYDLITRMEWHHFTPMFQASLPELLAGARQTTYSFLGFHILFLVYPFIEIGRASCRDRAYARG